jgi:Mn-containing catalase
MCVSVGKNDAVFARQLQRAIGGVEGETIASKTLLVCPLAANVAAESADRTLRVRLYDLTKDPCMQEMLSYSVARDTMHQQLWLAGIRAKSAGAPQASKPCELQ